MDSGSKAENFSHAPFWGEKLSQPHFYKADKMPKFYRHWNHRIGLESLKVTHAIKYGKDATDKQKEIMNSEISNFIDECYKVEQAEKLKDVYVTDHSSPDIKYLSKSEEVGF